jgi:hypothetical protein
MTVPKTSYVHTANYVHNTSHVHSARNIHARACPCSLSARLGNLPGAELFIFRLLQILFPLHLYCKQTNPVSLHCLNVSALREAMRFQAQYSSRQMRYSERVAVGA